MKKFKHQLKQDNGFTIIEVMIVLAIAAVIMLIVFLAVPALQRNSRNTQYRSEAGRWLSAANEFVSNSNGTLPVCGSYPCNSATAGNDPNKILGYVGNVSNITSIDEVTPGQTAAALTPTLSKAVLETGVTCGATGGASVTVSSGGTKSIVLVYATENTAGGVVAQCSQS